MKKHPLFKMISLVTLVAFILTSCTSNFRNNRVDHQKYYSLTPKSESTKWINGREYSCMKDSCFSISVGYINQIQELHNHYLEFDVIITNNTNDLTLIDPSTFSCIVDSNTTSDYAIDPEQKINEINDYLTMETIPDHDKESRERNIGLMIAGGIIIVIVSFFVFIFNSKNENKIEEVNDDDDNTEEELQKMRTQNEKINRIDELKEIKERWENETLRKTTLEPNHTVEGKVYFPTPYKLSNLTIYIPNGKGKLNFQFGI